MCFSMFYGVFKTPAEHFSGNETSVESQKGIINIQQCSIENQKGAIAVHVMKVYGNSALLVFKGT